MEKILIITNCSAKKRNYKTKASDLYQGQLFKKVKKFARSNNFDFKIISAKYGLLNPYDIIEPYDKTISSKKDIFSLQKLVLPKFKNFLHLYDFIIVIMSFKYREIINIANYSNVFYLVDQRGIGGYKNLISKLLKINISKVIEMLIKKKDFYITHNDIKLIGNYKIMNIKKY